MRYTCLFICYAKCRQLQVQVQRQQRKQKLQLLLLQRRLQQRSWQQVSQSVSQSIKKVRLRRRRYASTRVPNKMQLKTKTKKPVQADGVWKFQGNELDEVATADCSNHAGSHSEQAVTEWWRDTWHCQRIWIAAQRPCIFFGTATEPDVVDLRPALAVAAPDGVMRSAR